MSNELKITAETLKEVMDGILSSAEKERESSQPYKDMFEAGDHLEGLLRHVEMSCSSVMLDACSVLEKRRGVRVSHEIMGFLLLVPWLAMKIEKEISAKEGICCCVDKTYYLLAKELERLCAASSKSEG